MTTTPEPTPSEATAQLVQEIMTVQGATARVIQHPNTWVANLTTTAAAVVAVVSIYHPGFKEQPSVQAALGASAVIGGIATQIAHFVSRRIVKGR